MTPNKCRTCKYCKIISDPEYQLEEYDCRLEMWDYFLEDIPCPKYVELIEEPKYPRWMEE
jgi:hypothetical protein